MLRVVLHWVDHGVKIFRVDNPHTKPFAFWEWLIAEVKKTDPEVLFLAEAFTRPAIMHELGRIGFTQSYTYFTWRTGKQELQEYMLELVEAAPYMRPNFFVNTPDILHASLQYGGPPAFKTRAVLAALLSPSWGVYSGLRAVRARRGAAGQRGVPRLGEVPGARARLEPAVAGAVPDPMLNELRREHECLHWLTNLTFHDVDNEDVMAWSKRTGDDVVLVVLNLAPHGEREATVLARPAGARASAGRTASSCTTRSRRRVHLGHRQLRAARPVPRAGARLHRPSRAPAGAGALDVTLVDGCTEQSQRPALVQARGLLRGPDPRLRRQQRRRHR